MNDEAIPTEVHLDGAQVRCLAHPLRSRLLATLRLDGPLTSARLADRLNTNTGATSYHLRRLADVGLVAEVEEMGTARERWWAASHDFSVWRETDFDSDPDDRAAAEWLVDNYARSKQTWRDNWYATRQTWSKDWREAAVFSDIRLDLTPKECMALHQELLDVITRYRATSLKNPDRPGDVVPVMVLVENFPAPELSL